MSSRTDSRYARKALLDERALVAPRINAMRVGALVLTIVAMIGNEIVRAGSIGPSMPLLGFWLCAACLLYVFTRRPPHVARASLAFVPLVDLPVLYLLLHQLVSSLKLEGVGQDAPATAVLGGMLFALLVLLTGGLVERWQTAVTTTIAAGLQLKLNYDAGVDSTVSLTTMMSLFFVAAITATLSQRVVKLVGNAVAEQQRRERMHRYFSPQVIAHLDSSGDGGGAATSREATVLFADLRDFTALSERLSGDEVIALLNRFHESMVEVLFRHGGTLDKYLGDGLMAYFGAPVDDPQHPAKAVRCAQDMQAALHELNRSRSDPAAPELRMGVGIHTGSVIIGDVGAHSRREFTVIGLAVNIAARLQEMTKTLAEPIVVSQTTRARSDLEFARVGSVEVRGLSQPMDVFVPQTLDRVDGGNRPNG